MKRTIAIILLLALCLRVCGNAYADAAQYDLSAMTEAQLIELLEEVRFELMKFCVYDADDILLFDACDVKVTFTGYSVERWIADETITQLYLVIENSSDLPITVTLRSVSINGWMLNDAQTDEVPPGKSAKAETRIWDTNSKADIKASDDVKDIEFVIGLTSDGINSLYVSDPITIRY